MPTPPRPQQINITEAIYDADTHLTTYWVEAAGHTIVVVVPDAAIENRKLIYALAHEEVVVEDDFARGPQVVERRIVNDVSEADERALDAIFAEHFDRFEEYDHDWREQRPGKPDDPVYEGMQRRAEKRGQRDLPSRVPERVDPEDQAVVRRIRD